jgi:hypothetical protein
MRRITLATAVALTFAASPSPSSAAAPFDPLPPEKGSRQAGALTIRVVRYDGSTNGAITVEVQNPSQEPRDFSARGLYFVPQTNPDRAPQRLGAVGPFSVRSAGRSKRVDRLTVEPGATERLTLDVYCIDSHRPSPTSKTPFRVAKDRVPPQLTRAIDTDARRSAERFGGVSAPAAKSVVQSEVWKNRDKKWIELDGEGSQEAAKRR